MGWASAGGYFDAVADALIEGDASDEVKTKVCSTLIGMFRGENWDTHLDSLDRYADDPAIVQAFREHEIYLTCQAEDSGELYACTLNENHDGDHDDGNGNRWRDYTPGELLGDARALAKALFDRMRDFVPDDAVFGEGISWGTLPDWMTDEGVGRALWAYGAGGDDD